MDGRSIIRPRNYVVGAAVLVLAGLVMGLGLSAGLGIQRTSRATTDVQLAASSAAAAYPESPFVSVVGWETFTVPELGAPSPAISRNAVDFPQPEGPSSETNSPRATSRSSGPRAATPLS